MASTAGRVVSPDNVLDARAVFEGGSPDKPPLNTHAPYAPAGYYGDPEQRVTIWNKVEQRKLSGNSAPFRKNLGDYIRKHPEWELYAGQDKEGYVPGQNLVPPPQPRAPSSRQSPREVAVPRERESRRVAQMNQRRAETTGNIHDLLLSSPRDRSYYRGETSYTGRQSEPPLRCDDIEAPTHLPDPERIRAARAVEMKERRLTMIREAPQDDTDAKTGEETHVPDDVTVFNEQWKAAQEKVAALQAAKEAERSSIAMEGEMKRKAESEQQQACAAEASVLRIEKRLKRIKITASC